MAITDNVENADQEVGCEYCGELLSYEDILEHELTICYWRPSNRRQRELMEQVMHYIEAWLFYQEAVRKTFEAANANRREPPSPLEERLVSSYDCTSSGRPPKGPAEKIELTIAIIGSVGSGKSTITGHLIYKLGGIYKSSIKRFEENSDDVNKCSSKYTWVLEKLKSKCEKDTTGGISMWKFESPKYMCTVIDAPGRSDLIKTMIVGTFPADCAVIVVNSTTDFKTGLSRMRDQAFLAFILGIKQIICCCNKMDATIPKYSKDLYDLIKSQVTSHLNDIGYNSKRIAVVPMSGLEGDNLIERSPSNFGWYKGPTFIEAIDNLNNPLRAFKPLRIPVGKVVQKTDETVLLGRVETGTLRAGMKVNIGPVEVSTRVLAVRMEEEEEEKVSPEAYSAGSVVEVVIKKCLNLERGCVISDNKHNPAAKVASFISQIYLLENCKQITEDYEAVFPCHTAQSTVRVSRILSKVNYKTGAKMENNPTNLKSGEAALVELITATPVVVERVSDYPTLGRFVLTDTGSCVAIGVIKNVEKYCVQVGAEKKTKKKK